MCECGKAQRISLWLDLLEWTKSFLRNLADQCRGFSRRETYPKGRTAVCGRQQDRCAHPFNPNHFPVVEGGATRIGSISERAVLSARSCFWLSLGERAPRAHEGAKESRGRAPRLKKATASCWEVTSWWEVSAAQLTLEGQRFAYEALLVPSRLSEGGEAAQLFSSMPNRIQNRICIANATSQSAACLCQIARHNADPSALPHSVCGCAGAGCPCGRGGTTRGKPGGIG